MLQVVVYPGHQRASVDNNVYLVFTPERLSFGHIGDQSGVWNDITSWIRGVKFYHDVDVLVLNRDYLSETLPGFDPELVIPSHINEMTHSGSDRISYSEFYSPLENWQSQWPFVMMTWDESYQYNP